VTGKGVRGEIDGKALLLGNARLMADAGIAIDNLEVRPKHSASKARP
jgi:cation transport ATPase